MGTQPSVLILDDGELGDVYRILLDLGMDVVRRQGKEIGAAVTAPRDLLISAGRRTLGGMPELVTPEAAPHPPRWVCVHNQDFLPMRERLHEKGVNYLLQRALDEDSLRRFLIQLLRPGDERRRAVRLPLGGEIRYRTTESRGSGWLIEIAIGGCRILTPEALDPGTQLGVHLPSSLGGGRELSLMGAVVRTGEREVHGGQEGYPTGIAFETLDPVARERLECIVRGERIGTKITPLAAPPDRGDRCADAADAGAERRVDARHRYESPVKVLGASGFDALGTDLSLGGVRLTGCSGLEVGARVVVALRGTADEQPLTLEATVIRTSEDGMAALAFGSLPDERRRRLESLLGSQPLLDSLDEPDPHVGRTVVAEVRPSAAG